MTHKLTALVPLVALAIAGCNPAATDLIEISVNAGDDVEIDTICDDPCLGDDVSVEISFEEHVAVDFEAEIQILQYRVDYALAGGGTAPDYHADTVDVVVGSGGTQTFGIDFAAASQREALEELLVDDVGSATATVTFAGYDHQDAVLQLTVDVPILFGHYDSSSDDAEVTQ